MVSDAFGEIKFERLAELPYNDYFEYYSPDFKLHITPSNMTNQNSDEYLNKIKVKLFENLRMLPHAPGVQMQRESLSFWPCHAIRSAIPEDAIGALAEAEDADEDNANPDERVSSWFYLSGIVTHPQFCSHGQ